MAEVAVPARGAGCIQESNFCVWHCCSVAVPARGAGCICRSPSRIPIQAGCRPREGCGLHPDSDRRKALAEGLPSPRGVRVASLDRIAEFLITGLVAVPARGAGCISQSAWRELLEPSGCRPREGCGLHQQKDTNPYQHICRFHTTRRLSITQGQQKMQGVLCLLYRKRECNLIVGSANRLFLRDKNAREKQRLAGNC